VNLKKKQTHSAQTDISHFRRENDTQHYEPKYVTNFSFTIPFLIFIILYFRTNETQTYRESSTNVPRKVNYLAGLRNDGKKQNKFKVVDLTLDL
jgi:hypothetical protein